MKGCMEGGSGKKKVAKRRKNKEIISRAILMPKLWRVES
jgi:hypothetical protein